MIHLENKPPTIDKTQYQGFIYAVTKDYNYTLKQITCVFMTDDELLKINKEHLNHDYYTDIITFDLSDKENTIDTDLYISIDRVKENATINNVTFENEMYRVMIHGVLHLVGLNDKTKEQEIEIRKKEDHYLTLFN